MRIGIISDIHANIEALQAVYRKLRQAGVDQIYCLGDIVGYGPDPAPCIDFLIEHEIPSIKGNHDAYASDVEKKLEWNLQETARTMILWTQKVLDKAHLDWLHKLPLQLKVANVQMVHASMECLSGEYWPYIIDSNSAQFHFYLQDRRVAFCGHVHIPLLFSARSGNITMQVLKNRKLPHKIPAKFLVSVGSTGQPRDMDWRAAAAIYDTESCVIKNVRVSYDVKAVLNKFKRPGMPKVNPQRIFRG
ncbi:MAG: metallophosphoesterase family protein [Victivallaceae bacterium]|nr:metallophosphoesterase family protein [Victivallaceae bacterium]MDD3117100.1 metallophosphoesterase family protein [Victivallaceae bacterium]MDD4317798.1 metallophosphoesterase family protein [Victivallaceae bacterium]